MGYINSLPSVKNHPKLISSMRFIACILITPISSIASAQDFIGGGIAIVPEYPGAKDMRAIPLPIFNYERGAFFASSVGGLPGIGVKADIDSDLTVGVRLGLGIGRQEDRASILKGLGDIDNHATYGVFMSWNPGRFSTVLALMQATNNYGLTYTASASYILYQETADRIVIGGGLMGGDDQYMQTWFGISQKQAANSRANLPSYDSSSGLSTASMYVSWSHSLTKNWGVNTTLGEQTLLGDAADSPVTESKARPFGLLGVTYTY